MKPLLLILSFLISTFSISQDTLHSDTPKNSAATKVQKKQKNKKKRKFLKTLIPADTLNQNKGNLSNYTANDSRANPYLIPLILLVGTGFILLIIKKRKADRFARKPYNYFKNDYIKSLGWAEDRENNPKREELLRQLDSLTDRQAYYRFDYLQSEAWQRKRYVVLKRDKWTCVYCGKGATQVHHKQYAKNNIGSEPIDWLVSVCKNCHDNLHS
jgi:hypothetical protein